MVAETRKLVFTYLILGLARFLDRFHINFFARCPPFEPEVPLASTSIWERRSDNLAMHGLNLRNPSERVIRSLRAAVAPHSQSSGAHRWSSTSLLRKNCQRTEAWIEPLLPHTDFWLASDMSSGKVLFVLSSANKMLDGKTPTGW